MFKTLSLYKFQIEGGIPADASGYLTDHEFMPCAPTQAQSVGWVAPRTEGGDVIEFIGGHVILKLMIETKRVPSDVVDRALGERCKAIESATGRKPGKKERKELKEEINIDLLPHAFPSRSAVMVWFDPRAGVLALDAAGPKADTAVTALSKVFDGLSITPIQTMGAPGMAMTHWLMTGETPAPFTVDRECELKATDESKATVKYANHELDIGEIHDHISTGKVATKMALTWNDKASFVLTDTMVLKKVTLLDVQNQTEAVDEFDADVILTTETLRLLAADLIVALGGEYKPTEGQV